MPDSSSSDSDNESKSKLNNEALLKEIAELKIQLEKVMMERNEFIQINHNLTEEIAELKERTAKFDELESKLESTEKAHKEANEKCDELEGKLKKSDEKCKKRKECCDKQKETIGRLLRFMEEEEQRLDTFRKDEEEKQKDGCCSDSD